MDNDFEIAYGTPEDVDELLNLYVQVAAERRWIGTEPGFDRARKRTALLDSIARPHETPMWVARAGGALVGSLNLFYHRHAGLVVGMLVGESYRRQGIGQAFIDRVFAWAHEHGVRKLHLHVFPHNEAARMLYLKNGFVEVERFERDVARQSGEVWDAILMRKDFE
jgi:RimJ/RimL family protein N-acetyltransferase